MDRETADEIKGHFSFVAEGLRSEMRVVAEGVSATQDRLERVDDRLDRFETRMAEELNEIRAMIRISFGQLERLEARFGN